MANVHCHTSQTPLSNQWHLTTSKTITQQLETVLGKRDGQPSALTKLYSVLCDTSHEDFKVCEIPIGKRIKMGPHEGVLLSALQSSLRSLTTNTRNDLIMLELKQEFQEPNENALHGLEEDDPTTGSLTRADGLALQAYMKHGFQLEAECVACR